MEGTSRAHLAQLPPLHRTVSRQILSISTTSLGNLCKCLAIFTVKKSVSLCSVSCVCLCPLPLVPSLGTTEKRSGSFFIAVSLQKFIHINKILLSILLITSTPLKKMLNRAVPSIYPQGTPLITGTQVDLCHRSQPSGPGHSASFQTTSLSAHPPHTGESVTGTTATALTPSTRPITSSKRLIKFVKHDFPLV